MAQSVNWSGTKLWILVVDQSFSSANVTAVDPAGTIEPGSQDTFSNTTVKKTVIVASDAVGFDTSIAADPLVVSVNASDDTAPADPSTSQEHQDAWEALVGL